MKSSSIIVVDVGASKGLFTEHVLKSHDETVVFAIEPNTKENLSSLQKIERDYPKRIHIFPYALSKKTEIAPFYAGDVFEGQIGSLNRINLTNHRITKLKLDLNKLQKHIPEYVQTKSVYEFIKENKLNRIDFLKIDTQGSDIDILRMFLESTKINCLVLEVDSTYSRTENLYKVDNSLDRLVDVIYKYSLRILKIIPNSDLSEFNVFLAKDYLKGCRLISSLDIYNSITFGKYIKIIGVNRTLQQKGNSKRALIRKITIGLTHPRQSLKSLYSRIIS